MTDGSHVIWAYDRIIFDLRVDGLSVSSIRERLRQECGLHVGEKAIRDVLKTMPKKWEKW